MTFESIADQLLTEQICKSRQSANATANYAFMYLHGQKFNLKKTSVQTARARLRRIGIDIAQTCDINKFNPVRLIHVQEIELKEVSPPIWYRHPSTNQLRLVA